MLQWLSSYFNPGGTKSSTSVPVIRECGFGSGNLKKITLNFLANTIKILVYYESISNNNIKIIQKADISAKNHNDESLVLYYTLYYGI